MKSYSKTIPPVPNKIWRDPLYFIAFGFGSGALPFAPGTFGTLLAIPFYWLMQPLSLTFYLTLVIIFTLASAWICQKVSREIQYHDHPGMCIDEFIGFFVTMIHAPPGISWIIVGFLLFRLFDIWKPWPINLIDKKMTGGFGMIFDDIVAGLFAMIIIQILSFII
jgi:phosphatidylglycerophosphatase A